jgi:hypothetical protein
MQTPRYVLAAAVTLLAVAVVACDDNGGGGNTVRAPIDAATVIVLDSNPPKYTVDIIAGLPDGCSSPASHSVRQDGLTYEVTVLNRHTGAEACTAVYGQYELAVELDDVQAGQPYTVKVNDQVLSFVAE